ncbi:unnamed protein product [Discula destructiva]
MSQSGTREATHAGSWYEGRANVLANQLAQFLDDVPTTIDDKELPIAKARVIIAPHAGYSYSGPCAAWAYKSLDLSSAKRVFLLGPAHAYYLAGSALTTFAAYETPFGELTVDAETIAALRATGKFSDIPPHRDEDEHSLEMHLPYLWKRLEQTHGGSTSDSTWPKIVPILIGDNNGRKEKEFGALLAPYLRDPENAFIVSSDFCHWGSRFRYTAYVPAADRLDELQSCGGQTRASALPTPIHEGIRVLDQLAMDAVASGRHDAFVDNLAETGNTVCGRHPIGVTMAALEVVAGGEVSAEKGKFTFVRYERSSLVERVSDSSVSYAAAYAVI